MLWSPMTVRQTAINSLFWELQEKNFGKPSDVLKWLKFATFNCLVIALYVIMHVMLNFGLFRVGTVEMFEKNCVSDNMKICLMFFQRQNTFFLEFTLIFFILLVLSLYNVLRVIWLWINQNDTIDAWNSLKPSSSFFITHLHWGRVELWFNVM